LKKRLILSAAFLTALLLLVLTGVAAFLNTQPPTPNMQPAPTATATVSAMPQPTPTPTAAAQFDYNKEAQRLFDQARREIEHIRNVTIPQVDLIVISKDWAIQNWGVPIAQADQAGIQRQENIYKALLLIHQNASLYQATVDWAGYYMAATQAGTIYVVQENLNLSNTADAKATLAHELTHILPVGFNIPQHYTGFDATKARAALTEGDATFTASYVKNQTQATTPPTPKPNPSTEPGKLTNNPGSLNLLPSIPASVSNIDYFPYKYGERFIQALYLKGGWVAVNRAYENPPNSTEQVLHPERYFSGELPERVSEVAPSDGNWTRTWGTTYGEFFIQNLLATHLDVEVAEKAAEGWGGDKLAYFEKTQSQFLVAWSIKWDTSRDAGEFFVAFHSYMKNAGATETVFGEWQNSGVYQKIVWNQAANSTLIVASTDASALQQFG
jgi:hypothetical protein